MSSVDRNRPRWGWSIRCKNCGWSTLVGGIETKEQLDAIITDHRSRKHGCDRPLFEEKIRLDSIDLTSDLEYLTPQNRTIVESKLDEIIKLLADKEKKDSGFFNKLTFILSSMYQNQEINKDTYNKLDRFLHEWLDSEIR